MGYQALLFCPDEKCAQTLTQVLSDLEFSVEACTEPFAAVKKLMAQGFDAVVVDCENEQNASLLFKSARNSASNQSSLAVAVVEGPGGVAKAFRLGANLVLTKPINVEQSKGTLRVARGLLRKNDAARLVAAPAAATQLAKPAAPKTISPTKPAAAVNTATAPAKTAATSSIATTFSAKPAPAAVSQPFAHDEVFPEPATEQSQATSAATPAFSSGGAASAPARAGIADHPAFAEKSAATDRPAEEIAPAQAPAEPVASEPAKTAVAEPAFTFGGANVQESSGKGKKILLLIAVAALIAAAAYIGWTQYRGLINPHAPVRQSNGQRPLTAAPTTPSPNAVAGNTVPLGPVASTTPSTSGQTSAGPTTPASSITTQPSIPQATTNGPAQPPSAASKKPAASGK
jgi:CheY-like chemotaxis protein